jgi:glycosyltransferase involved in cell wall biosynthesis
MRVGVSLLGLPSVRQGGAGFYTRMLVRGLAQRSDVEPVVLAGDQVAKELDGTDDGLDVVHVAKRRRARLFKAAELALAVRDPRHYSDGYHGAALREVDGCDLVHYPLSFATPPAHSRPIVMTCMDLQHLELPDAFPVTDRVLRAVRWHRSLRMADRIVAPSEYTRASLAHHLRIAASRVDVIPLACDDRFFTSGDRAAEEHGDFLFYPASPLPAKNHARLARAFARVARGHPSLRLALTGPVGHDWGSVEAACRAAGIADRVDFLGHLSLDRMRERYASARALVFPTLFEGFGIPLVEAMASGCVVLAADVTSVPEVVGDAAILFDPTSTDEIADAIERCLALSDTERARMIARGHERAAAFRVDRMVDDTVESYRRLAAEAA